MSNDYIQSNTQEAFDNWLSTVNVALVYPNPATNTESYTQGIQGDDGKFYAPIDDQCPEALLQNVTVVNAEALIFNTENGNIMGIAP